MALLPGLGAYLLGAAVIGSLLPPNVLVQTPYYIVAGVLWAFPAYFLIRWAERPSRTGTADGTEKQTHR